MKNKLQYLDYPIFSIGSNGKYVLTSGGGGGPGFGIEDLLEVHHCSRDKKELTRLAKFSKQQGILDSIVYSSKLNLWAAAISNSCIFFDIQETNNGYDLRILCRFITENSDSDSQLSIVRFSPSAELVVTGGSDRILRIWRLNFDSVDIASFSDSVNLENKVQKMIELKGSLGNIKDCDISNDSNFVVACSSDTNFYIWSIKNGNLLHKQSLISPVNKQTNLLFRCSRFLQPNDIEEKNKNNFSKIITVGNESRGSSYAVFWKLEILNDGMTKLQKIQCFKLSNSPCSALTYSSGSRRFYATGYSTGEFKLFDSRFKQIICSAKHQLPVTGICFHDDDRVIITASGDYSVTVNDISKIGGTGGCINKTFRILKIALLSFIILIILFEIFVAIPLYGYKLLTRRVSGSEKMIPDVPEHIGKLEGNNNKLSIDNQTDEL